MIGIEYMPGVWFYVDPKKVEIPQDGARLISALESIAERQLMGWIVHNCENTIKQFRKIYAEYTMEILIKYKGFHHNTKIILQCKNVKTRLAAVNKDIHDPDDVIGEFRTDGPR